MKSLRDGINMVLKRTKYNHYQFKRTNNMKSAIFESINDRSNIANAYMRIVNEANEKFQSRYNDVSALYEGNNYPLCIYDKDGDKVIDLTEIEVNYKDPSYYEKGFDDYYIALAFDKYGLDELYKKLIEYDSNLYIPPERVVSLENGFLNTIGDVEHAIEEIGREWEENLHKDEVEVAIPEWAAVYFENADASGLTEEDKKLADDYFDKISSQGYELAYDGENLGFCAHPEFGLADNCVKYYLVKSSETNESAIKNNNITANSLYNLLKPIDKNIASIVSYAFEHGKSLKEIISEISDMGISGTSDSSSRTGKIIKILCDTYGNDIISESVDDGWFNEKGNLIKKLPRVCIIECSKPGEDAYLKCFDWVNKLPYFVDSLDIPLAKGYLKSTGGWEDDEIASFNNEDTAIRILWLIANDIKEGIPYPSISDGSFYKDIFSNTVTESRYHNHKVILTNIQWPDGAYDENMDIPGKDSMVIEVGEGENIRKVIDSVYIDSYGFAPVNFHIARNVDLGFVDVDDSKIRRKRAKNEMVSQSDLDKLKKKNPKLKDISEER